MFSLASLFILLFFCLMFFFSFCYFLFVFIPPLLVSASPSFLPSVPPARLCPCQSVYVLFPSPLSPFSLSTVPYPVPIHPSLSNPYPLLSVSTFLSLLLVHPPALFPVYSSIPCPCQSIYPLSLSTFSTVLPVHPSIHPFSPSLFVSIPTPTAETTTQMASCHKRQPAQI